MPSSENCAPLLASHADRTGFNAVPTVQLLHCNIRNQDFIDTILERATAVDRIPRNESCCISRAPASEISERAQVPPVILADNQRSLDPSFSITELYF